MYVCALSGCGFTLFVGFAFAEYAPAAGRAVFAFVWVLCWNYGNTWLPRRLLYLKLVVSAVHVVVPMPEG